MSLLGDAVINTAIAEMNLQDPGYTGMIDNRSPRVDVYLAYNHALPPSADTPGNKWCGYFVRWCYGQHGVRLPNEVAGGRALKQFGDNNPQWVIWRAGDAPCAVQAGDIFVTARLNHVAMVEGVPAVRGVANTTSFTAIEGNQTDPNQPTWGQLGVKRRTRNFTDCAMILRYPQTT